MGDTDLLAACPAGWYVCWFMGFADLVVVYCFLIGQGNKQAGTKACQADGQESRLRVLNRGSTDKAFLMSVSIGHSVLLILLLYHKDFNSTVCKLL